MICERSPEAYAQWQFDTFQSLYTAHQAQVADYEQKLAQARLEVGVEIRGRNPLANRRIISEELKKGCVSLLCARNFPYAPRSFEDGDLHKFPELESLPPIDRANFIQFLETAFEWEQITYDFSPYFWARKNKWLELFPLEDVDPNFSDFLRAGAARVAVPVTSEHVRSVLAFLSSGCQLPVIGTTPPLADNPFYRDILAEVESLQGGNLPEPEVVGESWESIVPTNLVYLQPGSGLNP